MSYIIKSKLSRKSNHSKKRVLVVSCYFDYTRRSIRHRFQVPQAMGPVYLAGAFSKELCDVRIYNEQYSGPIEDERLLSWPDMLVMTGLTSIFDRMLHLTAYVRTKNPNVIVVAGGPAIRAIPTYSQQFFDYCCCGDIEQMKDVITDAFGKTYVAQEMFPRFDLCYWTHIVGYAETSRNCNFHCSFCTLTGEGMSYKKYDIEYIRKQIIAMGKRHVTFFIDNNFYGNDTKFFLDRLELIKEMRKSGYLKRWGMCITNDFFGHDENLELVRDAGCSGLFSGIESFDTQWLKSNKVHNIKFPQLELIRKTLDAGLVFGYGLIMDVTTRRIADLNEELDFILGTPDITLPGYLVLPIPFLGTPLFYKCLAERSILPETKIRDLDCGTLSLRPLDPMEEVSNFLRKIECFHGFRLRILRHSLGFYKKYRTKISHLQMMRSLVSSLLLCTKWGIIGNKQVRNRTYISTNEQLDNVYTPAFNVDSRYKDYFKPTMVTDKHGDLAEELAGDLSRVEKAV